MIRYCRQCLLPSTKPDLRFDALGVCAACNYFHSRQEIDWELRRNAFHGLIDRVRAENPTSWDCIVPVSGGKDSTAQVLRVLEEGLNPLCVTATTCDLSDLGRRNIENLKSLGVDHVSFSPNPAVRAALNRFGLMNVGDISWPEHVGIFTIPVRVAVAFKIPLIVWGENPQNEYGGPKFAAESFELTRRWLEEFGGLLGLRVSDLQGLINVTEADLEIYRYPHESELAASGITGIFLGHYFPWDGLSNALISQANGFETFGLRVEGSVVDYENLDNHQTGIHDYFKFLKFGFGRATDIASLHIRRGRFSREQALVLTRRVDGNFPWTYLGKPLVEILEPLGLTVDEFIDVCDRFTNRALFKTDTHGNLIKDDLGNLSKTNYDNLEEVSGQLESV